MSAPQPSFLDLLHRRLTGLAGRPPGRFAYRIPALWQSWCRSDARRAGNREVAVEPIRFSLACLEQVILPARGDRRLAGRSLSQINGLRRAGDNLIRDAQGTRRAGDWIRSANIYGMLLRTSAAWDHDADGRLEARDWTETGTFLKAIWLLPLLARMGIDAVYLLPVTKIGRAFRKGEIGCPYAAKSFFDLDPALHDRLLDGGKPVRRLHPSTPAQAEPPPRWAERAGDLRHLRPHPQGRTESLGPMLGLREEFGAFVEAAHALGIRVMLDLAPRTASRDSDLILDHPDWFYWIDAREARDYAAPYLEGIRRGIPNPSELGGILKREVVRRHLAKFRWAPNIADPQGWRRFAARCRAQETPDVLRGIIREFGMVTPPGFSDVVNDPQPPWSDVTFLRLFQDHPIASARHIPAPAEQPPYVLTDTIKASVFPGRKPNLPLWRFLSNILPYYQRFGVDGARVDMGHALPPGLQRMIIDRPRRRDPDFCFIAEELDCQRGPAAKRDGYNAIIGSSWWMMPRHAEGQLHRFVYDVQPTAALPAFAAAETPDTPRAAVRDGGQDFTRLIGALGNFLPSGVPFIHSGLELLERQPLNLGLDLLPRGQFVLPRKDPYYGKLGYFDAVALHWTNAGASGMIKLLSKAASVRRRFAADLANARNSFIPQVSANHRWIITVGWRVERGRRTMLVVANIDFRRRRQAVIELAGRAAGNPRGRNEEQEARRPAEVLLEIKRRPTVPRLALGRLRLTLEPGDVKVLLLGESRPG